MGKREDKTRAEVQRRLTFVRRAERYGIAKVAVMYDISRTQLHEWLKRYRAEGVDGLVPRSRAPRRRPRETPLELQEQILAQSLLHPSFGCDRLKLILAEQGNQRSAPTIQRILNARGIGRQANRRAVLEQARARGEPLTREQLEFLEAAASEE